MQKLQQLKVQLINQNSSNTINLLSSMQNQNQDKFQSILYENYNNFQVVILNEPENLNALTLQMQLSMQENVKKWNEPNSNIKVVYFKGNGGIAFCAGGNMKNVYVANKASRSIGTTDSIAKNNFLAEQPFRQSYILSFMLSQMKPIQICVWDGIVMGGGVGISIHAKFRIATERAVFAMPESKLGLFTDIGMAFVLTKLRNNIGVFLGITGERLAGLELYETGIANFYVQSSKLALLEDDLKKKVTQDTSEKDILSIIESYCYTQDSPYQSPSYKFEEATKELFSTKQTFQQFYYNLQHDQKHQEFSQRCLRSLSDACPLSVCIIFEQMQTAGSLDLRQNLQRDFLIFQRFLEGNDFMEGIRCVLIDKGKRPSWQHNSPLDVTQQEIDHYFTQTQMKKPLEFY